MRVLDRDNWIDVIAKRLVRLHDSGGQRHQVTGFKPGPAVQYATPLRRDRRRSIDSAKQSARNSGDCVSVPAAPDRGVQCQAQVISAEDACSRIILRDGRSRDGRPGSLQRFQHPPVIREVRGV